ncbi:MAG: hypothetical protein JRD89_00990 [Deltaproteobacteria bacterium]|nr:hypothetical protein [Deltaproteobacteria bacterium]
MKKNNESDSPLSTKERLLLILGLSLLFAPYTVIAYRALHPPIETITFRVFESGSDGQVTTVLTYDHGTIRFQGDYTFLRNHTYRVRYRNLLGEKLVVVEMEEIG